MCVYQFVCKPVKVVLQSYPKKYFKKLMILSTKKFKLLNYVRYLCCVEKNRTLAQDQVETIVW